MFNQATLIGNVGKDPEIRRSGDGKPIANLSLATSETWKDKASGERKERTEWHRVVIFNEALSGVVERFVKKGSRIMIQGSIRTRKYTASDNTERYTTEIVLGQYDGEIKLPDRAERPAQDADSYGQTRTREQPREDSRQSPPPSTGSRGNYDLDDDIPF